MSPRSFKPEPSLVALGEVVKALRREKGLTQERLAKQAGITVTYVSRIENGRRNLTWTTLTRLCHGLGVQRSDLVALVNENEAAEKVRPPRCTSRPVARGLVDLLP